jgi:hypothetical protein
MPSNRMVFRWSFYDSTFYYSCSESDSYDLWGFSSRILPFLRMDFVWMIFSSSMTGFYGLDLEMGLTGVCLRGDCLRGDFYFPWLAGLSGIRFSNNSSASIAESLSIWMWLSSGYI